MARRLFLLGTAALFLGFLSACSGHCAACGSCGGKCPHSAEVCAKKGGECPYTKKNKEACGAKAGTCGKDGCSCSGDKEAK